MDHQGFAQLLGSYGEFIGAIAVVATLVYLAIQIRTARADVDANSFNSTSNNLISVETAFLQEAEIWTKANEGKELTAGEEFTFNTLLDIRFNHAFFAYRRSMALKNGREKIHAINFAIFLSEFPIAYERWLSNEKNKIAHRAAAGWDPQAGSFVDTVERMAMLICNSAT
jgi:hypothetical protein